MKKRRIVRKIDSIGRVMLPKELRMKYQIDFGNVVEIYTEQDGIYLKKFDMEKNIMERMEQKEKTARKIEESLKRVKSKLNLLQKETELRKNRQGS